MAAEPLAASGCRDLLGSTPRRKWLHVVDGSRRRSRLLSARCFKAARLESGVINEAYFVTIAASSNRRSLPRDVTSNDGRRALCLRYPRNFTFSLPNEVCLSPAKQTTRQMERRVYGQLAEIRLSDYQLKAAVAGWNFNVAEHFSCLENETLPVSA
jgi:hypothetical protein